MMRYIKPWIFLLSLNSAFLLAENFDKKMNDSSKSATISETIEASKELDNYREAHPEIYNENCWSSVEPETDAEYARSHNLWGIWLPEGPPMFRPFLADPRQLTYSVGWRFNDRATVKNVIDVSFGDTLPIFRWCDIWKFRGDLQLELEGGVWAIFDPLHKSAPLIDADYYVGIPITYAFGNWALRLRGYHISTHIGDEFLINHPHFDRRNPSIEAIDLSVSWQKEQIRLYGVLGWVCCQDDSFRVGPFYLETGLELRLSQLGYRDHCNRLYSEPFFGMHFRYQSHFKKHINQTYVLGWEWGKVSGIRRKFRLFLEYHDGYSLDGQFCKRATHYLSFRGSYGF
ncbi:DUF1207 domain-containing protein [Candidatus Protochlamydia amoebophila]|jgi:hypothetical protein|uniref:DUF1207 domain-containing protein n=1 Tax=Protochlamydia amoebophila (strain UWE25) TaxID=264201 RepID=Q6MDQ0_PARUW|nr:DUF1207 domain-containing protein [Candidatus Protochlamydia amoebophila]CAF23299.1 unnamed protein product [Candidatus Protochlamydia amoebophila UWE25]